MLLEFEQVNELGQIESIKNSLFTPSSIKKYVRSYKVNRDGEVQLLYGCKNRRCHGKGWLLSVKPNGLKEVHTCTCVDKVLEKVKS